MIEMPTTQFFDFVVATEGEPVAESLPLLKELQSLTRDAIKRDNDNGQKWLDVNRGLIINRLKEIANCRGTECCYRVKLELAIKDSIVALLRKDPYFKGIHISANDEGEVYLSWDVR